MRLRSSAYILLGTLACAVSAWVIAFTGYVTPGGSVTVTGSGAITKGTTTISCSAMLTATINTAAFTVPPPANSGTVTAAQFSPGSLPCYSSSAINLPWTVQVNNGSYSGTPPTTATSLDLTILNVGLRNSQIGDCVGNVKATFSAANDTLTIPATALTGANPSTACHLHGPGTSDNSNPIVLTVSPQQTVNVTAP